MAVLVALLVVLLAACSGAGSPRSGPTPRAAFPVTTIEVHNRGLDTYTIRIDGEKLSLGWVQPGRTACLRIPSRFLTRTVEITAEHQHGQVAFRSTFSPRPGQGWEWQLGLLGSVGASPFWTREACLSNDKLYGYTEWECELVGSYGWVRVDVLMSEEGAAVVAHEMIHMRQADQSGGCHQWNERLRHAPTAAAMEAEAFCGSAKVAFRQHRFTTLDAAMAHYAGWLATYRFGLSEAQALSAIRAFCASG